MTDYVAFEGRIEPLIWGKATYMILRLPPEVCLTLGDAKRVEGEIADHPVNLAPVRAPVVDGAFLWAGKSLLARIGVAPGDLVEGRLRPADPDLVDPPDYVEAALRAAGLINAWRGLTAGKQRGLLYKTDTAKSGPTRAKRIAALLHLLHGANGT